MKRLAFLAAAACLCGGALPGTGWADMMTLSQSVSIGPLTTNNGDLTPTITVQQFNPGLGKLTLVTWTISGKTSFSVDLTNNSSAQEQGQLDFTGVSLTIKDAHGVGYIGDSVGGSEPYNLAAGGGSTTISVGPHTLNQETPGTENSGLLAFEGTGTVDFSVDYSDGYFFSPGSGGTPTDSNFTSSASGTFEVTYTFTPTVAPEPASVTLLGLGVAGLAGYGWRRKRTA